MAAAKGLRRLGAAGVLLPAASARLLPSRLAGCWLLHAIGTVSAIDVSMFPRFSSAERPGARAISVRRAEERVVVAVVGATLVARRAWAVVWRLFGADLFLECC